ncbi:hypothetical protein SAMD00019534_092020 [Acytostelium subglobosum LB1]|uniref:hypothetical protein n=1 Tax=Acytostelium subglobosum LB1 TaxID=1410327 RepID=UPI000644B9EA|nr:hypothetical protein SAMD00019534_092020 [Acytostelium subglobosum LB1]GAM26027.1 hypothetical protein SAMD00019534_092020 [Acytostelium subglobosum LB1]|eukprot:XP_012751070.1 hypothetical protein SAMD00019534_092020 [Acytostelium subglobosum LB1]
MSITTAEAAAAAVAAEHKKTKEDWRKAKELEEARKAGTAPAEKDEDGNDINPHIPQYIMKAPWYIDTNKPGLKHQKAPLKDMGYNNSWYQRGVSAGPAAVKYRKGACTNCGSMTHAAKDCCERPRKVGAKYTNDDIKPDEVVQVLNFAYDAKRDPYNGYDPNSYQEVMSIYEKAEAARRKKRLQEIMKENNIKEGDIKNEEELLKEVEDKAFDTEGADLIQKIDPKSRTTVRNLRIREDTAKYLYNLDMDSAHYEPKSRSMRENPLPHANIADIPFAGDNFTRTTGDTREFMKMQMFSWDAVDKGQDVDLSAAPSQASILHEEFLKKKELLKNKAKEIILNKYGGEESLKKPEELSNDVVPQSEIYQEYSAAGKLIKGVEKMIKSKYDEDVYINNHKAVWGSYWENGVWGFQCCKQTIKISYCTGEAGRKLKEKKQQQQLSSSGSGSDIQQHGNGTATHQHNDDRHMATTTSAETESNNNNNNNKMTTDKDRKQIEKEKKRQEKREEKEKKEKLKRAIKEQEQLNKTDVEKDERKRAYNSLANEGHQVTEEEMEAYNLKRIRSDDPMANYKEDDL